MDWITTSGSSIHEAKSNALDQLGIVADEAEFDIVSDVEKGLFGRVKSEAKIRARVKPKQPTAKEERGRNRSGGGNGGNRNRGGRGSGGGNKGDGGGRQKNNSRGGRGNGGGNKGDGNNNGGSNKSDRSNNGGGRDQQQRNEKPKQNRSEGTGGNAAAKQQRTKREPVDHEFSRAEQETVAIGFLDGLLDVFDMEGSVALAAEAAEDDAIEVEVTGSNLGLLVGQKGVTLNAIQELTRTVVQREADGAKTERLRVDVAGYRERRRAALHDFATKIAEDVLESGSEKVLEPMGPADRKVVHDTVNDMDGVETGSEGEEPRRRVVIRPV